MSDSVRSYEAHVQSVQGLMSLLLWENPVKSATAFIECLIILFVIQNGGVLRFILHLAYLAIGVAALTEIITKFLNGGQAGLVSSFRPGRLISLNKERLQLHSDTLVSIGEEILYWVRRVLDARDLKLTLTAFTSTWILYVITAVADFTSLATTATVLAFTLPALYSRFQTELNHAHAHFSRLFSSQYSAVQNKINTAAGPQIQMVRSCRQNVGAVFGYAPPASAAPVTAAPVVAQPAQSIHESVRSMSSNGTAGAESAHSSAPPSVNPSSRSPSPVGTPGASTPGSVYSESVLSSNGGEAASVAKSHS